MDLADLGRVAHEAASFQASEEGCACETENGQRQCTDGAPSRHFPRGWRGNQRAPRRCPGERTERSYAG